MSRQNRITSEDIINENLTPLLKEIGAMIFVKDYNPTDTEILGIMLSKFLKWDGHAIAKAVYSAFEDSNFHTLNTEFEALCKKHGIDLR